MAANLRSEIVLVTHCQLCQLVREAAHLVKIHGLVTDLSPLKTEMFEEREAAAKWLCVAAESLLLKASGTAR